jgi:ABC-2 type transport system permease protein
MNKIWLILKNEFITTVARRSFLITLVLVPLVGLIILLITNSASKQNNNLITQIFAPPAKAVIEGYVDETGMIKSLPSVIDPSTFIAFPDRVSARKAVETGIIQGFYIIPIDYIQEGEVIHVRADYNPFSSLEQSWIITEVLRFNLLAGNVNLLKVTTQPLEKLSQEPVSPDKPQRESSNPLTFFVPYIVMMLFYVVILTSASLMLNSVTTEKQNRVMEILMVSMTPTQMLAGKIIALGLVGLVQTIVWTGSGYFLLKLTGEQMPLTSGFQLPVSFLAWGIVFFILGYAVYASLMAGVGALVPNLRESSQATTVMVIPMIIPMLLLNALINAPNGGLAVGLSLFPLTAPIAMMTRLSAGDVPIWQPALSSILLIATAYLTIRAVAGMFRAQNLLTGQTFRLKVFFQALIGKV